MAFICKDCGNKSTQKFPAGKCPACDSFNIKNTNSTAQAIREKEPKTLIEIVIMLLLWSALAYGVWDKLLSPGSKKTEASATVEEPQTQPADLPIDGDY